MHDVDGILERHAGAIPDATTALQAISNPRVRNLVRGALASRTNDAFAKTMASIHRECTGIDATAVGNILQNSVLAYFSEPAAAFPETASPNTEMPFYTATRLDLELAIQQPRLAESNERLINAIEVIGKTNEALLVGNVDEVERLFAYSRAEFGTSKMMALKALSLRNSQFINGKVAVNDAPVLEPFRRPRRLIITSAFEDTSNHERDYMRLRRFFIGVANGGRLHPGEADIVKDLLSPLHGQGDDLASRLQSFGRGGLIDLVAFLFRAHGILARLGREVDAAAILSVIPPVVRDAWATTFSTIDSNLLQDFVGREDQFHDLAYFTHLPAWSEYADIFEHRLDVEECVGARLDGLEVERAGRKCSVLVRESARLIAEETVATTAGKEWHIPDGGFARTIALIASVEADALDVTIGEDLLLLLDRTINVPTLLTVDEIETSFPRRRDDALYEYLRNALLNDAEGGSLRDHALRRAVERLLKERFDGDILKMMRFVDSADGHVSKHLFLMCSETFLSNLYGLYRLADDVMEAQTGLLEWEGDRRDDQDAILRAKSLRLLIKLRKVRGSIEETRIYVDPLRLLEWLHEHLEDEIRALQPLADEILASDSVEFNVADTVTNSVQPRSRLLSVLDRAYHEFSANKVHGAASYIGRRVRHGKFNGHLAVELKPMVDAAAADISTSSPAFGTFLKRWYRELDAGTHDFARERIHIRSKARPRGLIVATIQDLDKQSVLRIAMDTIGRALRDGAPATQIIALILDYCWLLIEVDLKRARIEIEDLRRHFVIDADQHFEGKPETDVRITEHTRALNAELGQRFDAAKSWLTRRANASPSASVALMVDAVLDEVGQRFEFKPIVELSDDLDIDLVGHNFHFFYDTLWILVTNAAEYGRLDGGLVVAVVTTTEPDGRYVNMRVEVTSKFNPNVMMSQRAEIDSRMSAEIGDAMDGDGGTGLRKLRSLVEEAKEIVGFERYYEEDAVRFVIRSRYPLS